MSTINRLLSRRDKHSHGIHSKKEPKNSRSLLNGLFIDDQMRRPPDKEEEKKIKIISQQLAATGIKSFDDPDIYYALGTEYAKGSTDKAYELLATLQDSEDGILQSYDASVKILGAVNRQGVTCYLDALLFAMFARLASFEAMLYKHFDDLPKKKLSTLLRLWVNILRSGKLITVDITKQVQLQLANCGWEEATKLCQQDASEAFTFVTGVLALPLLTLKMDIFHTGTEDASDDHKFINERLLELAIPDEPGDGHIITLEECLELFFNNKIEVKRYLDNLERRGTLGSTRSRVSIDSAKARASHVEVAEVAEVEEGQPSSPQRWSPMTSPIVSSPNKLTSRRRAPSIIQETYFDEKRAGLRDAGEFPDEKAGGRRRVRKEVMMPAWQFFSLIPWYTNNMPSNDAQVAAHFSSTRPILGICLKRYYMKPDGKAAKRSTHIDIPLEIGLPNFIQDENLSGSGPAFGSFKLSLQSVVCHQGISVESGHYISLARTPDPSHQGNDTWMRFDDLASERVASINAEQFLKESNQQTPYLLFYQVIPIEDDPGPAYTESDPVVTNDEPPPSYADSVESRGSNNQSTTTLNSGVARRSTDMSNRISLNAPSTEDSFRGRSSMNSDRQPRSVLTKVTTLDDDGVNNPKIDVEPPSASDEGSNFREEAFLNSGPNSLTADRQGSRSSKASSRGRANQSEDRASKRMSASLTRLANRISRDRLGYTNTNVKDTPPTIADSTTNTSTSSSLPASLPTLPASPFHPPPDQPSQTTTQAAAPRQSQENVRPSFEPVAPVTQAQPSRSSNPLIADVVEKVTERSRLKKETREKEKGKEKEKESQHHHHHHHHHNTNHLTKTSAGTGAAGTGKPERECTVM